MRFILMSTCSAAIMIFCSACFHSSVKMEAGSDSASISIQSSKEKDPSFQAALQQGNALLKAIQEEDFESYEMLLNQSIRSDVSRDGFLESCKKVEEQFGTITNYQFICPLKMPLMQNLVWRVDFVKKDEQGNLLEYQLLFRIVFGTIDGKVEILGMGFI